MDEAVEALAEALRGGARVIAATGAGISTAAGVRDFRSPGGTRTRERFCLYGCLLLLFFGAERSRRCFLRPTKVEVRFFEKQH